MRIKKCEICEKDFKVFPCRDKARFCSDNCKYKSQQWKNNAKIMAESNKGKHCHSEEWKKKLKEKFEGDLNPSKRPEVKQKLREINLGKVYSETTNKKKSLSKEKNPNWKNGATLKWMRFRSQISNKLRVWSIRIKQRDNWECVQCGSEDNVQADHIKPVRDYPHLVLDLNNGQTLCYDCHIKKTKQMLRSRAKEEVII